MRLHFAEMQARHCELAGQNMIKILQSVKKNYEVKQKVLRNYEGQQIGCPRLIWCFIRLCLLCLRQAFTYLCSRWLQLNLLQAFSVNSIIYRQLIIVFYEIVLLCALYF